MNGWLQASLLGLVIIAVSIITSLVIIVVDDTSEVEPDGVMVTVVQTMLGVCGVGTAIFLIGIFGWAVTA